MKQKYSKISLWIYGGIIIFLLVLFVTTGQIYEGLTPAPASEKCTNDNYNKYKQKYINAVINNDQQAIEEISGTVNKICGFYPSEKWDSASEECPDYNKYRKQYIKAVNKFKNDFPNGYSSGNQQLFDKDQQAIQEISGTVKKICGFYPSEKWF